MRRFPALLLALLPLAALPARAESLSSGAEDPSAYAYRPRPGAPLPLDAPLRDEAGRTVSLRGVADGHPVVLAFGYFHCPTLCGVVREDLFGALARTGLRAGRDYEAVALSIDPAETPADAARAKADGLARYPVPDAEAGWHFLTGDAAALSAAQEAVGFRARFDPALKQFLHPAGLVFATSAGAVSGYLLGVGYAPADLEAGLARASQGEVAAPASPVLLLCFQYDAATGRYTFAVTKALRAAAVLTALAFGGTLALAHRRERRS